MEIPARQLHGLALSRPILFGFFYPIRISFLALGLWTGFAAWSPRFAKVIYAYTSAQAEDDGILFDVTKLNPAWEKGLFNYVTTNLLSEGYLIENAAQSSINVPNLVDLLNQANEIVRAKSNNFRDFDTFYSGAVELPSGTPQDIFIQQNETGKFTIMKPEDY